MNIKHKIITPLAVILAVTVVSGCSTTSVNRNAEAAPVVEQTSAELLGDDAANLGNYKDLGSRLPFGIRNELEGTTVRVSVEDDPYDWLTDSKTGSPTSEPPLGFNGLVLESGDFKSSWFYPRSKTREAPFELTFRIGLEKYSTPVLMSFDEVYHCFTNFSGQQVPCTDFFSVKQWYGWAWRSADRKSVGKQIPWICNSTSAEFSYVDDADQEIHTGRGRLECGSTSAARLGNAIVLEEVKQ